MKAIYLRYEEFEATLVCGAPLFLNIYELSPYPLTSLQWMETQTI